ncbi:MAG: outer membrane lipoprotein chaperone LolA [Burkholderiales bacterium]
MRCLLAALLTVGTAVAHAGGTDALRTYLRDTQTVKARFAQVVVDKNLKRISEATGTMQLQRPGRFRWEYAKPYEQLIVGDGARIWIYDKDLNQVTMRKLDRALGSTPAALLAGSNEIEKAFTLADAGTQDGMEWVEATPRSKDSTFERVRMGFGKEGLEAMELRDAFGQTTFMKFGSIERNPKLVPESFRFTPPKGADVIAE